MMKTHALRTAKLIEKYSSDKNAKILGKQLESLVGSQLQISQFEIKGMHTNEYEGRKWTATNHNLDFIAKKKGKEFAIGVEVKNTLDIIPPDEIDIKIDICKHLGIVPVFAVRWIKPYIDCIRRQGGFGWSFKTQMFPFGYEGFTKEMFKRLSELNKADGKGHPLEFPITVRNSLPEKPVRMFNRWIRHVEDNPPSTDTTFRCGRRK